MTEVDKKFMAYIESLPKGPDGSYQLSEKAEHFREHELPWLRMKEEADTGPAGAWTRDELEESLAMCGHQNIANWLEMFDRHMTPEDRYYLTLEAYTMAAYGSIPKQRIIALKKIRPDNYLENLDPELKDVDPITVYRGGGEFPEDVRKSFSWTTDKNVAIWFYRRRKATYDMIMGKDNLTLEEKIDTLNGNFHPACWKATIRKNKIIGVDNGREEHEVIQHCGVQNIEEFTPTEAEIREANYEHSLATAWNDDVKEALIIDHKLETGEDLTEHELKRFDELTRLGVIGHPETPF